MGCQLARWKFPTVAFACLCTIVIGCGKILYGEDTTYAKGYSSRKFNQIIKGMTSSQVLAVLGAPLECRTQNWSEVWHYWPRTNSPTERRESRNESSLNLFGPATNFRLSEDGKVAGFVGDYLQGDFVGISTNELVNRVGPPSRREVFDFQIKYRYSLPTDSGSYKMREVLFDASGHVTGTVAAMYYD
jgi:hypothetical protein